MNKQGINLDTVTKEIYAFYHSKKRMPSYQEICSISKIKSKNTAHSVVQKLKALGKIGVDKVGKLIPTQTNKTPSMKLLGVVEAGFPTPSEESLHEQISLDDWIITKREASFMLKVKGDSMKDAGILDGDMVIVERNTNPKVGQIVVAEIDGSYTLKYLRKNSHGSFFLEAANKAFKQMHPMEGLQVHAVVKAVVRKYAS